MTIHRSRALAFACALIGLTCPFAQAQSLSLEQRARMIGRATFGATPAQLRQITNVSAWNSFVDQQLAASQNLTAGETQWIETNLGSETIPHPTAGMGGGGWSRGNLEKKQLYLGLVSDAQLREVMTQFWEMHFSTYLKGVAVNKSQIQTTGTYCNGWADYPGNGVGDDIAADFEWIENRRFRQNSLTTFRALLRTSFESPAMRLYLHTVNLFLGRLNEDYARELMELHTLGAFDLSGLPNYTNDSDIEEVTRLMRGFGIDTRTGNPLFCLEAHNNSALAPIGNFDIFSSPNISPGVSRFQFPVATPTSSQHVYDFLDHLVDQQSTKEFLCGKLIEFFIGRRAVGGVPDPLRNSLVAAWGNNGDLQAVLSILLKSTDYRTVDPSWHRVKNPLETALAQARALQGTLNSSATTSEAQSLTAMADLLDGAGQPLFGHPSPDGYPIQSQRQVGTSVYFARFDYAHLMFRNFAAPSSSTSPAVDNLSYDLMGLIQAEVVANGGQFSNAADVVTAVARLVTAGVMDVDLRARAERMLNTRVPVFGGGPPNPPAYVSQAWASSNVFDQEKKLRLVAAFLGLSPRALEK